jgi:hypothetical protein
MLLWGAVTRRPVILLPCVNKSNRMRCITPVQLAISPDPMAHSDASSDVLRRSARCGQHGGKAQ